MSLSKEFRLIVKDAEEIASSNRDLYLCVELATYSIVKFYNSGKGTEKSVCKVLDNLSTETRESLEGFCWREYTGRSKKIRLPESAPLPKYSPEGFDESTVEVTVSDFLRAVLVEKSDVNYEDPGFSDKLYTRFGLCSEMFEDNDTTEETGMSWAKDLIDRIMKDGGFPDTPGNLKMKKLSIGSNGEVTDITDDKSSGKGETPYLDKYAVCMTDLANSGEYDPVIGRNKEVTRLIEILCCKKKNNPAILGDPGCGKTSVVELLAQKLASGDVPDFIKGRKIYSLSAGELTSGTTFRGQLEERISGICKEVADNFPNIILYFDEFHQATKSGSESIADLIKAPLGRGKLQLIMSTTNSEYRRFIEKDGALKRRFEPIDIKEPEADEVREILEGISKSYSEYHGVEYTPEVLDKIVDWSGRYISDRFFPDKAITVLDVSGSLAKLRFSIPEKVKTKKETLDKKSSECNLAFIEKIESGDFKKAKSYRDMRDKFATESRELTGSRPIVSLDQVAEVISGSTNIPVDKIKGTGLDKIRGMKKSLESKVIGQDHAVKDITVALQRNLLGLRDPRKPISTFLLVGPTGVGKSLIAKTVASEFFGSESNLISISCSEYMSEWGESKLLGAAPGYVGFSDTEPRLYELKRKPYSVLLIDEVEKSSKKLYNVWLNLLEEGEVTLSTGEKVSAKNCIVIFTGNVGTKSLEAEGRGIGFGSSEAEQSDRRENIIMREVSKEFRPEFLNRISKTVVFNSLGSEELRKIFGLELEKLQSRLKESGIEIKVSKKATDWIIAKSEPNYGARSLQRLIVTWVEQELCEYLLEKGKTSGSYSIDITGKAGQEKIKITEKNNDKSKSKEAN